jgi:hypothetical protein
VFLTSTQELRLQVTIPNLSPLNEPRIFKFKVQAESDCGTGIYSPETEFLVTTVPARMEPVNIESIDCSISITWDSPVSGGLEITDYRVEIKGSVVLFKEVPECTVDSCVISMTDLTLEPYELRQGDLI